MSNRLRRDGFVQTPAGAEGIYADDTDGMLGHIGREHLYAERTLDVTPASVEAFANQRMWKEARGIFDGANPATVELGEVDPGTMWLVEAIVIDTALVTDAGFAKVRHGSLVSPMKQVITVAAQGASVYFGGIPMFLSRGKVWVVCTQTAPGASTVWVTAQVRVVQLS